MIPLVEIIFRIISGASLFSFAFLRIFISSMIITIVLSFSFSLFNKKVGKFLQAITLLFMCSYCFFELGIKNYIGVYASLQTSSQLGAVASYAKEFLLSFKPIYYCSWIPFLLLMIFYFISRNISFSNKKDSLSRKFIKIGVVTSLVLFFSIMYSFTLRISFMQNSLQTVSNVDLFKNTTNASVAINQFGTNMYFLLDVRQAIFGEIKVFNNNGFNDRVSLKEKEIDDKVWNEIITNEDDYNYQLLNNYFINRDIPADNEYTGVFKDKNLIMIMMESVNDIIINEDLYPNFYKLYSDGWSFKNNYSPRNGCATGNNEMSGMLSLYSIYNICTANVYKGNRYFQSIFNLFNNADYYTSSMHDFDETYYFRNTIHTNMGSSKFYSVDDLEMEYSTVYGDWPSDIDFFKSVLKRFESGNDNRHFMTWLTTVTPHLPYDSSKYGDLYYKDYMKLGYSAEVSRYMSKLKVFDNAIGVLIDGLEKKGILDDTVIIMYGDHYPYGLTTDDINTVLKYDINVGYEADRVPFVIYNSEIESKQFDQYTSYLNILPTVANLFGLDYDPRFYMGTDIFSKNFDNRVVFADGSWRDSHVFYDASLGKINYYDDYKYSVDQLKEINKEIEYKQQFSKNAIIFNYFNYLDNKFNEYKSKS